ncbi:MAG TPA: hypothetical protein DGG95_02145, partial [Cytophagales bacterium]|nr:hypothetical protein [Cytophagales bacterium]
MFFTSTKSKFLSICYLFSFIVLNTVAQVHQTNRKEFLITRDMEAHAVMPVDTMGIILYRSYLGIKENQLEITRLDTALQQIYRGFLPVPKEFMLAHVKANRSRIYFLFKGNSDQKGYLVIAVNILDGGYFSFPITNAIPFNATEFVVNRESVIIGGYFNYRPVVIHYAMATSQARALPGMLNLPGEITQLKSYPDGGFDVIISAKNLQAKKCIWVHHYDAKGDMIKT